MIKKISLNKVASYKSLKVLETDKKVNLIYGLNGTGKSIISNFLHSTNDNSFKDCSIEGLGEDEILVYNQKFIHENFFESENLRGIFTLSKTNKDAEQKIVNADKEINKIKDEEIVQEKELQKANEALAAKKSATKNKIWEIKTLYSGGDRVFEFCLEGYKNDGLKLLNFVQSLPKPATKPTKTIAPLKEEVQALAGDNAQKYTKLPSINFASTHVEKDVLLQKQIVGNENSTVAEFINKLGSSDWIKLGFEYLPEEVKEENESCPFCQEKTISKELLGSIKDYFDESYENDLKQLNDYYSEYSESTNVIPAKSFFEANPKLEGFKKDFELKYNSLLKILSDNEKLIEGKIKSPSQPVTLKSSEKAIEELELIIESVNKLTDKHNSNIDNKDKALADIKKDFWEIIRWDYDQTISAYLSDKAIADKNIEAIKKSIQAFQPDIVNQKAIIVEQQKQTINVEEAITNINQGLIDIGIEDFKIAKHSENLYKISRNDSDSRIFQTLSEGEKMIISFLYFIELCRGKKSATDAGKKKIIVIDDPISSLSHIYVFNVGRLIHNEFLRSERYEQIFILTHSLYFFYELTDTKKERREMNQKLFRLRKNSKGSEIIDMKYEEIQNDYHSYWFIIKDDLQPPALVANCMRNIIEYFFNFVEKKDLNNVFQKPAMQENRFQAFNRYINRESHALGQNIFDLKEFNYLDFKDAFALVFKENGYKEHYMKMVK